jgi:low affinity Fe/Cu permease
MPATENPDARSEKQGHWITPIFSAMALWSSRQCGRPSTFVVACLAIIVWAGTGPMFNYSDTWQLVINTGTTIITFLMVFLIQNTQNRDMSALHLKLDELIRVNEDARNKLMSLEDLTEEELEHLKANFTRLAEEQKSSARASEVVADLDRAEHDIDAAKQKNDFVTETAACRNSAQLPEPPAPKTGAIHLARTRRRRAASGMA